MPKQEQRILERDKLCMADKSDMEIAGTVRMLMRDDLDHEPVCTAARDRIVYLSQEVTRLRKKWDDQYKEIMESRPSSYEPGNKDKT